MWCGSCTAFLFSSSLFLFFLVRASKKKATLKCNIESSFREGKQKTRKRKGLWCVRRSVFIFFWTVKRPLMLLLLLLLLAVVVCRIVRRTPCPLKLHVQFICYSLSSSSSSFFLFYFILFYSTSNKFIYSRWLSQCTARLKTTALFCLFICCARW